jgi:hypothetical protein
MPATKPNVAALVEQMPDTDKEIQAKQEGAKQAAQPNGADQPKPKPDRLGAASKFTGPDPVAASKIFNAILSGGRESILELIGLIREPSDADYKNYKPGYVLHGLVIQVGRAGQGNQCRLLSGALASQLANKNHSKAVKGFFIRELRVLGGKEVLSTLGKLLFDDELCEDAAQALLSIHDGTASQFRSALKNVKGRNRVTLIQALGLLQDTASAPSLQKALNDEDRDVRRTAAWALANLGDASAADALLQSADTAQGWERDQATKACLLLGERLTASGKDAEAVHLYAHLRDTRKDPADRHIRDCAERALSAIPHLGGP